MTTPKRAHPRFAYEANVTIWHAGQPLRGMTSNLSRGGLCASVGRPLPPGAEVQTAVVLVFDVGVETEPLMLPARACWCTQVGSIYQVGLAFAPLDAETADYLTLFLKHLDTGSYREPPLRDVPLDERFGT